MLRQQLTGLAVRAALPTDAPACGRICFDAFRITNEAHAFPPDFPSAEVAVAVLSMMFSAPGFFCVVAEHEGRIVGSNCLDERSVVFGVGPVTVDPGAQNLGVGRMLMESVMNRAHQRRSAGVRLVQAAFHNRSLALYSRLSFEVREPLSCIQGRTLQRTLPGCTVRPAQPSDLDACDALSLQVHGFDRSTELAHAIKRSSARVVERAGRVTGYATDLAFFGHATAESNLDLQSLIASADSFGGPGILVPSRNGRLLPGACPTAFASCSR